MSRMSADDELTNGRTPAFLAQSPPMLPPLLVLSIPAGLGEAPALKALVQAVQQTQASLGRSIEASVNAAKTQDEQDQAYWLGNLAAYSEIQELMIWETCGRLGIDDQLDACESPLTGPISVDIPPLRPCLPEPDSSRSSAEILDVLYAKRDHLASLAAGFNAEAQSWKDDGADDLYSLHHGMSLGYATACDLLEQALARIIGLAPSDFIAFITEHGTNRGAYQ